MERPKDLLGPFVEEAMIMDDTRQGDISGPSQPNTMALGRSPLAKPRSLSDSGGTPLRSSALPHTIEPSRRISKDDSSIGEAQLPVTPRQPSFRSNNLHLAMPARDFTPPHAASDSQSKPVPLSPKLDHSQIYASPTNILPRRSRGLDFSRAATSLHHSTLAEQSSPDSSPTVGSGRAMAIPGRGPDYGRAEQTSSSLWSIMGNHDKMVTSSSVGSAAQAVGSDSSTSSDNDEIMDEDTDDPYIMTPEASRVNLPLGQGTASTPFGSPAASSLISFQQRQRPRKLQKKKHIRGPFGLGFSKPSASISKSPPSNSVMHARRESISWQANQLHISGADAEESGRIIPDSEGSLADEPRNVVRRAVTRRGNLLPKTKTFARIRAALLEEGAPADAEFRREAEVVKQVRESDTTVEHRLSHGSDMASGATTALSSPNLNANQDSLEDVPGEEAMSDLATGLSGSFKQQVIKNSKGKSFWDTFSESSSAGGARTTPPPAAFLPRGSSSGISEDIPMDSPSLSGQGGAPVGIYSLSRRESSRSDMPQASQSKDVGPPSAVEITRRINSKRRREDDFDPVSFKRRAVSPGVSAHNSPILQSPMQRDMQWGSRPGSNGGEKGGSSAPSDSGSAGAGGRVNNKPRVGFQGMVDTNDGIMRMSIE